jgi:cystathionine beta-lyase
MTADPFDLPESFLRSRRNSKWNLYPPDVLPAFIAEMDFAIAEPIQQAIRRTVDSEDYGYPMREGGRADRIVSAAFVRRMKTHFGWDTEPDLIHTVADLVQGTFAAVTAFSEPGDGVVLQVPCYPPFREAIKGNGRAIVPLTMTDDGERFGFDLEEVRPAAERGGARMLLVCNPHNPTGRVHTRQELLALAQFAEEFDLTVICDEIHSDLVYPGARHIPFASLSPEIAARTITLHSATKSFNIPGLRCAVMHFGNAALRDRFEKRVHHRILGAANAMGVDATEAAWLHSDDWLKACVAHLQKMRDRIAARLGTDAPEIGYRVPEATYLAWLDCSALKLNQTAFDYFYHQAKIGFSPGENFDKATPHFVRFNFATSTALLDRILDRFVAAVAARR